MIPLVLTTLSSFKSTLDDLKTAALAQPELEGLDLSDGSPDARWLSSVARVSSVLGYYLNRFANEAFLTRARLRRSVIDHCAMLGYELSAPTAESVDAEVSLPRAYPELVTIGAGAEVTSVDGSVVFTLDRELVFPPGTITKTGSATEGRSYTESAMGEAPGVSPTGQRVALRESPFAGNSEVVLVNGVRWTRVRNLFSSNSASNHYVVERDEQDAATIVFGDGVNGRRPEASASIEVQYRTTLGRAGRVRRGALRNIRGTFLTASGVPVTPSVMNPTASSGGNARESLDHARYAAPEALRAGERTVSPEDFAFNAQRAVGVGRVLCLTHVDDPSVPILTHVLHVMPADGSSVSESMIRDVVQQVTVVRPCMAGMLVSAVPATTRAQNFTATAYVTGDTNVDLDLDAIRADCEAAVRALYVPGARNDDGTLIADFGQPVPVSKMSAAVQSILHVKRVVVTAPTSDPAFLRTQFPRLGALSIAVTRES